VFANDIRKRVERDFGAAAPIAVAEIQKFIESYRAMTHTHPGDRVIRCIVHLANGKQQDLAHYIKAGLADPRDVMAWAEYDSNDRRIHDFNMRFPDAV
jgi:hypothetical protein